MSEENRDRIARLTEELKGLSDSERDAWIEELPDEDRDAIVRLLEAQAAHHQEQAEAHQDIADSSRWAAETDLVRAMDDGEGLLYQLSQATEPAGLLAQLDLIGKHDPRALALAVFAAVVNRPDFLEQEKSPAIRAVQEAYDKWCLDELRRQED